MKMLSNKSVTTTALLILLSLNAVAGMIILVNAAPVKDPTLYVSGSGFVELLWKSGKSQVYSSDAVVNFGGLTAITITPSHGWHIDAVTFDGNPQFITDEDGFSILDALAKKLVSINFVENGGIDDVETGSNVEAYPDPEVGLIFHAVLAQGYAFANTIPLEQFDQLSESWDIQTNATFDMDLTVYLVLNLTELPDGVDPYSLTLWRTEVVLGDVNFDGIVDGADQSIVANANPDEYDPNLDLNNDGVVNDEDVTIVSHNHGLESVWEPLESWVFIENDLVFVYGVTSHLSVFGVTAGR